MWRAMGLISLFVVASVAVAQPMDDDSTGAFFTLLPDLTGAPAPMPVRSEPPSPQSEEQWRQLKAKILADFGSRMTPEFSIPTGLRERTAFWFDIYTRYGEAHHVIHHVLYPWIVYTVVDTTDTLLNGKGPLWLRRDRAEKIARQKALEIRSSLRRLASRRSYSNLPLNEQQLFDKLAAVPGPRARVFREAAANVRTQLGQRDFYQRGLINSSRYLPYMEEEFKRAGLPTELTRLPFVESSFNEDARSKVGASGIWQIMPRTGRAYMIVSDQIDERNSPLKATSAAARLLRSYFRAIDSWPLAITSYNNGIGNTQRAIRGAGSRDLATIIARYHKGDFRFASSNFFTCFLAALYAEKYNELVFKDLPREPLQERQVIRLSQATKAQSLAKSMNLTSSELLKYNLDLRAALKVNALLPKGYRVHLPAGRLSQVPQRLKTRT